MFDLSKRNSGVLFALLTACGLGAITTLAKIFYADGGNALTLMLMRALASTLVFGLLILIRQDRFRVDPGLRKSLIALGIFWSGGMICYLVAVETISVSIAVLIFYFYPLLVLAYSIASRQLVASVPLITLFLGAFLGLYLALSGGEISVDVNGILFAILASCGAAFTFICGARVAPATSPLLMTFWINTIGLILIIPLVAGRLVLPDSRQALIALATATLLYLIAILSQFQALARLPAARAAFLLNLEPVVSIVLAYLVLSETLSILQACGAVLVLSTIILSLRYKPAPT
ncbi:MAG: DMT family transporter [Gammaproteobacteria bacterium]|nr:DMT family transporter [Gammaproteobacteria bacterium]MDH3858430.1 DMT family transporter [Gammaproteobacteria bacterium]